MPAFEVPVNLAGWIDRTEPPASPLRSWLADLPGEVGRVAAQWGLEVGSPYQPGGVTAWVAPARDAQGRCVVLKLVWAGGDPTRDEGRHEADGLRLWSGSGAVRLLDVAETGPSRALLLERCEPGTTLAEAMAPDSQHEVLAALLRRIWITPPVDHPFRSLASMCAWWADSAERRLQSAARPGTPAQQRLSALDAGIVREGLEMFRRLPLDGAAPVLVCTDLHAGNILAAQREPWLMIDPKPYVGDPTYDPLQHMLNCPGQLAADPRGFVARIAALLDLDRERLRDWLFARCVVESLGGTVFAVAASALAR
jgi:streptomycin 6-kinase